MHLLSLISKFQARRCFVQLDSNLALSRHVRQSSTLDEQKFQIFRTIQVLSISPCMFQVLLTICKPGAASLVTPKAQMAKTQLVHNYSAGVLSRLRTFLFGILQLGLHGVYNDKKSVHLR